MLPYMAERRRKISTITGIFKQRKSIWMLYFATSSVELMELFFCALEDSGGRGVVN